MSTDYFTVVKDAKIPVHFDEFDFAVVQIKAISDDFIPCFQTAGSAGADLKSTEDVILVPNKVFMIDCGFCCSIPKGYHAKITARSSMGKRGIIIPNAPGIIDSDYTLGIKVLLLNLGTEPFEIKKGDRIAQWLIEQNTKYCWKSVEEIQKTARLGGFGSTGK